MVAKKRTKLRDKVSRLNKEQNFDAGVESKVNYPSVLGEDPKAFLHQSKESKKEKMSQKHSMFLERVKEKNMATEFSGISKSAVRRRKRKLRDDLKPKMHDLLTSLENDVQIEDERVGEGDEEFYDAPQFQDGDEIMGGTPRNITRLVKPENLKGKGKNKTKNVPGSVLLKKNAPNIRNQKGAKQLSIQETQRFNQVLANQNFQQNPFGSLRDVIKMQKF
ncbi:Ribosome biogenesis protein SLX9 [Nakaseomyces bracarensis]|uniref:Ribosome biogenesis protein SLX9 n=1 Tax=Nakaseomyces bracarensis TaxID=273131 RepID=A0ABR4NWD7_9SACH